MRVVVGDDKVSGLAWIIDYWIADLKVWIADYWITDY